MREFELVIDEALKKGLSPLSNPAVNSQVLLEALGFRCSGEGLEVHELLDNPLPVGLDLYYSWPYPQLVFGEKYGILVIKNPSSGKYSIYTVSEDHQTVTFLYEIDDAEYTSTLMEVADFGKYLFMTNGAVMIYWDGEQDIWQIITDSLTIPSMRTVTNFKGQAIGGHILSPWYDCDDKYYVWSRIGSMDFTIDKDNEAGYRRCPYGGTVYNVRRLDNSVIGYSSKGVVAIVPASSATPELGTPATMGFKELEDVGLINQGAVGGDLKTHIYVGEDYILRRVSANGVEELGYKDFMKQLAGEDIIVCYDPSNKDFYIGNSSMTFLLSKYGMSEVLQHPSAVWRSNNQTYALSLDDSSDPSVCTNIFDMSYRGMKTVFSIETDVILGDGGEAGVDWNNNPLSWGVGYYKPINNLGIGAIIISGGSFKFRLRFETLYAGARLGYIKVRYKMTDLRGLRGVYAPPIRGQS